MPLGVLSGIGRGMGVLDRVEMQLTHHSERHPDPISRFATVHPPDRPTDRPTDGIVDNSVLTAVYALLYSDAANNTATHCITPKSVVPVLHL